MENRGFEPPLLLYIYKKKAIELLSEKNKVEQKKNSNGIIRLWSEWLQNKKVIRDSKFDLLVQAEKQREIKRRGEERKSKRRKNKEEKRRCMKIWFFISTVECKESNCFVRSSTDVSETLRSTDSQFA